MKNEIKEILDKLKKQIEYPTITDLYCELGEDECKSLLDYITNLEKENEKLKEQNKMTDEQIEKTLEVVSEHIYKSRNEKAIEYIKEHIKYECDDTINGMSFYSYHLYDFKKDELLNILQGEDKDE